MYAHVGHKILAWAFRILAVVSWGYAVFAIAVGQVRITSRLADVTLDFAKTPWLFVGAVSFYVGTGFLCLWLARPWRSNKRK